MTDKEIIKALECYRGQKIFAFNGKKPEIYIHDIIDLITRQQAENKALKTENLILSQKRFNIFERIEFTDKLKKQAKAEAIEEFAERLKEDLSIWNFDFTYYADRAEARGYIDNLVKEMVGEQG